MPNPTRESVHTNRPLTNISINYIQEQDRFVAGDVFPYVGVQNKSDSFFKFDKGDLLRVEATKRAAGAESSGSGYRVDTDTFDCEIYAHHKDVADQIRANADNPLAPDRNATEFVTQQLLLKRELIFGNQYMEPTHADYAGWDNTDNGADWSADGDNPIVAINNAMETVAGYWAEPNVAVMGKDVYSTIKHNDNVVDRYEHTNPGIDTRELLADLFGLDRIHVGRALYNSAEEGAASSLGYCIPKDAMLLVYAPERPQLDMPSAGYTFGWESLPGADGMNIAVKSFRMEERASDRIEAEMAFDMKQVSSALGYLFYDVTLD